MSKAFFLIQTRRKRRSRSPYFPRWSIGIPGNNTKAAKITVPVCWYSSHSSYCDGVVLENYLDHKSQWPMKVWNGNI